MKDSQVDGRFRRGERARALIASALLDLLGEGIPEPSVQQIARRAKVSERLVFHHFSDLESLFAAAAQVQLGRLLPLIKPVDPALPLERRIAAFVHTRCRVFELLSPMRHATLRREPFSREIAERLRTAYEFARVVTKAAFNPELAPLPAAEAAELLQALSAAASWENWDFLRRRENLSMIGAEKVVERTLRSLLSSQ